MKTFELYNGVKMPAIGYGTWQTPNDQVAIESIKCAIQNGYRHIDCASIYGNEEFVGQAIRECGIPREELFITNKVWRTERGYQTTLDSIQKSLDTMGLDYFDLYLIHWPASATYYDNWEQINRDTWKAMMEMYQAGKIRAIGVSNFMIHHLKALMEMEMIPMVNQIEYHLGLCQQELVDYCKENGIQVQAFRPINHGEFLDNEILQSYAKKYNKTVAQICIRWILQNDVCPLPKSVNPSRIQENMNVFDFEISKEDMDTLNALDIGCVIRSDPDQRA